MVSPAILDAEKIKAGLGATVVGSEVLAFDEVGSTNDVAKSRLGENAPEGLVVVADSQTGGKGRLGRSWHSPPGVGLYLSVLLRPQIDPARLPRLTLMAAVATATAIDEFSRSQARLKWPNDILLNGKKTCGILAEYCQAKDKTGVVVGIGVNVNHERSQLLETFRYPATSLLIENGAPVDRLALLRSILVHLDREYRAFLKDGGKTLAQKWTERSDMIGKKIVFVQGSATIEGTAAGLDEAGRLIVRAADGRELSFESGEITKIGD